MAIRPENYFKLQDGRIIKDIFELSKAFNSMDDQIFRHHVNESKNDFYNWIYYIVKDKKLAKNIQFIKDKKKMSTIFGKKIQEDVLKNMNKKKTKRSGLTLKDSSKTIKKTKQKNQKDIKKKEDKDKKKVKKNKTDSGSLKDIRKKMQKFVEKEKEIIGGKHQIPKTAPEDTNYGIHCPYKTFHCGALEFIFGIIIGLLAALVITNII